MPAISPTYRHTSWAKLLLLLVTLTWGVHSAHGFWLHHGEVAAAPAPCCDEHRGGALHLHAGQESERDCPFCAFHFSLPELISVTALMLRPIAPPDSCAALLYEPAHARTTHDSTFLRGPPVM